MKKISILRKAAFAMALGACATLGNRATANTITVDYVSNTPVIAGVSTWTYNVQFDNSELPGPGGVPAAFFEIADFDGFLGAGTVVGVPAGWVLSTPLTGSPIGPAISGNADSGSILNLVFTWTGANVESPLDFFFTVGSSLALAVNKSYSSNDRVLVVGAGDGGANGAGGALRVPGLGGTTVPDGGTTVMLLGGVLVGLGLLRRKLSA